jgi:hypothetical protein
VGKALDEKSRLWASGSIRDLLQDVGPDPPPKARKSAHGSNDEDSNEGSKSSGGSKSKGSKSEDSKGNSKKSSDE